MSEILRDGKFPLMIGGEHLVTLGALRAVLKRFPDLHIIQFDAHADLRNDYLGAELSHACVSGAHMIFLGDGRIHQFCIRSGEKEEFRFAKEHTDMHLFDFCGLSELIGSLKKIGNAGIFYNRSRLPRSVRIPRNRNSRSRRNKLHRTAPRHYRSLQNRCCRRRYQ